MPSENSESRSASAAVQPQPLARLVHSTLSSPTNADGDDRRGLYDIARSLHTLPELARQMVDADFAAVTVLNGDGHVTEMLYAGMTPEEAKQIGDPPRGTGVLGRLGEKDAPLRLEQLSDHPDSVGMPPNHPAMDALLGVRVSSSGEETANLYVARRPGRNSFSEADEEKVTALAEYAGIALDNARLYRDEHRQRATAEAAEQRLAAVIRGSSAGVVVKDARDGHFLEVSGAAHSITGVEFGDPHDVAGHPFERLYHRPDGTPMRRDEIPMNMALTQGVAIGPTEALFIRPDGTQLPVLVSAAPVFDSYGELDSAVCVFVDVTKLKELERAKDDFLSMITHDLRTPLTTIKGMAAAALDAATQSDSEGAISFLEPIDEEVDYLTELVSNLLDMTRIEAGGNVFDMELCHMADIAQDSLARMGRTRDARGRYIHSNVPPDLPAIFADPDQIGRVLDNLVSNALKYSDDGIGVTARSVPDADEIRIEVDDRGPGIPEAERSAIFDRFARLKGAGAKSRQGSGLGLAICRSIVGAHSGRIGVDPGNPGSIFWFTLPADIGADAVR